MARAFFEEVFDGPDSFFGQVFGPSREKLAEEAAAKKPRKVRVRLKADQMVKLLAGEPVKYVIPGLEIEVHRV